MKQVALFQISRAYLEDTINTIKFLAVFLALCSCGGSEEQSVVTYKANDPVDHLSDDSADDSVSVDGDDSTQDLADDSTYVPDDDASEVSDDSISADDSTSDIPDDDTTSLGNDTSEIDDDSTVETTIDDDTTVVDDDTEIVDDDTTISIDDDSTQSDDDTTIFTDDDTSISNDDTVDDLCVDDSMCPIDSRCIRGLCMICPVGYPNMIIGTVDEMPSSAVCAEPISKDVERGVVCPDRLCRESDIRLGCEQGYTSSSTGVSVEWYVKCSECGMFESNLCIVLRADCSIGIKYDGKCHNSAAQYLCCVPAEVAS
jgi:hypothetical protein